jgi:hypothetical protein
MNDANVNQDLSVPRFATMEIKQEEKIQEATKNFEPIQFLSQEVSKQDSLIPSMGHSSLLNKINQNFNSSKSTLDGEEEEEEEEVQVCQTNKEKKNQLKSTVQNISPRIIFPGQNPNPSNKTPTPSISSTQPFQQQQQQHPIQQEPQNNSHPKQHNKQPFQQTPQLQQQNQQLHVSSC